MSLLPQRKKSAGEIAKLREDFGMPGAAPGGEEPSLEPDQSKALPAAESPRVPDKVPGPPPLQTASSPKPVRSLRKSERVPLPAAQRPPPPADSKLPAFRHSDQAISRLRRDEALSMHGQPAYAPLQAARLAVIIPAYLLAIAAAAGIYFYDLDIRIAGGCVAVALLAAGFIFIRKPLSRHHAAFIAVISLLVIAFGALYYFPQLRYGT